MMDFISLARNRYSCRSYLDKKVTKELIEKVIEAARIAPSATNAQPWRFVVITQLPLKDNIISCFSRTWLKTAPVIIVACGDHSLSW